MNSANVAISSGVLSALMWKTEWIFEKPILTSRLVPRKPSGSSVPVHSTRTSLSLMSLSLAKLSAAMHLQSPSAPSCTDRIGWLRACDLSIR